MTMGTRCCKVFFPNYSKRNRLEILSYRRYVENSQHADQQQLTRRSTFDLDIESTHGQPGSCRARPVNVDDGFENIRCIRGLGGETLPAGSYALPPKNPKKDLFFAIGEGSRNFVVCFLHSSAQMCLYQGLAGARHLSPVAL